MSNLRMLMLMLAIAGLSACASNEEKMDSDAAAAEAAAAEEAAKAEEKAEEAKAAAEEKERMMREEAAAKEAAAKEAEAKAAAKEAEAKAATEARIEAEAGAASEGDLVATCTYDGQTRVISVVYDNEATGKACEVNYEKSSGVQTLWSADYERDYCLPQAQAFVEKQQGWGWDCTALK